MVLGFDRDTLLDLTVNAIPLAILLFFVVAFAVANPFGWDNLISTLQFAIVVVMFVLLAVLTYYAGKAISNAEEAGSIEPGMSVPQPEPESEPEADSTAEEEAAA